MPARRLPRTIRRPRKNASTPTPGKVRAQRSKLTANGLKPKHELFALEFLKDYNATQAYQRSHGQTTPKTASVNGSKLLARTDIRDYIKERHGKVVERTTYEVEDVVRQLVAIAGANLAEFVDIDGSLLPLQALPKHCQAALASVKLSKKNLTAGDGVTEDVVEIKLWDKNRALETLARIMGMIVDRNERGKAGDFDRLAPDELRRQLEDLRAARAKRLALATPIETTGAPVPPDQPTGATP